MDVKEEDWGRARKTSASSGLSGKLPPKTLGLGKIKGIFHHLPSDQRREKELEALTKVWELISPRARAIILIAAGVWEAPRPYALKAQHRRARKGEMPPWLMLAMNLLKDSDGHLSDRQIAQRVGVAHSTLTRNETYQRARQTNQRVAKPRKVFTGDPGLLARLERHR